MKSILHPVAQPTGSTGRKTRRVSNKKFNGPLKVALEPILEPVLSGTRRGGIFRDRLSKAATFLPFFTHAFKSVSVREMLSLHATLFEYSGEILATYSVTGARASPFRLFHRILPSRPWLPPKCNPLPDVYNVHTRVSGPILRSRPRSIVNRPPLKPVDASSRSC